MTIKEAVEKILKFFSKKKKEIPMLPANEYPDEMGIGGASFIVKIQGEGEQNAV